MHRHLMIDALQQYISLVVGETKHLQ